MDGKHGIGRVWEVLSAFGKLGCDVIGIQEIRRSGQSIFIRGSRYTVYCSGEIVDESQLKGQVGVGLAVKQTFGTTTTRPPEFISDRSLKGTLELRGRAKAVCPN